ncbi:MAG: DUF1345 domain-containing protein [Paludibacter sp.]|nr:DUF1345 domain-containing protein [Paludibacter sp.]
MPERNNLFLRMHPLTRLGISLGLALLPFGLLYEEKISILLLAMSSWIVFTLSFLIFSWVVVIQRSVAQIRKKAREDDGSVAFVFFMVLISSFAGILTVMLIIISKDSAIRHSLLFLPTCILGLILSWVMVHTIYIFHYAHKFYDSMKKGLAEIHGGLNFPGDEEPDYFDFAYFSFGLGCTFQVSDISITSRKIRRIALFHGLLSFVLNTFVVALTINLIAGLSQ